MKSICGPNEAGVLVTATPVNTSRVSKSRRGVPVHVCKICRPSKVSLAMKGRLETVKLMCGINIDIYQS